MNPGRGGAAALAAAAIVAACEVVSLPSPVARAIVLVVNEAPHSIDVRWTGTSGGSIQIEPCARHDVLVAAGTYLFEIVGRDERGRFSVQTSGEPGITQVIGVGPDGTPSLGLPAENPRCAAN